MKKVIILGLGFVGSAMATVVASRRNQKGRPLFSVVGIDLPTKEGKSRIKKINSGIFPFKSADKKLVFELEKAFKAGNLRASFDKDEISSAQTIIISINCDLLTNSIGHQKINLEHLHESIKNISNYVNEETLIIIESTVPPGTCEKIALPIFKNSFKKRKLDFSKLYLAHSYERVMPGRNYFDSIINFWRVYAGINKISADICENFLKEIINTKKYPLTRLKNTISSETGKLLENSYRAVNIAFMEEWGRFAEEANIDIYEVLDAIRMRPTHSNIRQPGFGVGGYCLTKDPLFAKIAAKDILNLQGHEFPFSSQSVEINSKMPKITFEKIKKYFNNDIAGKNFLLMGATYRQGVGDTRHSPSEIFARSVIDQGANLVVCDPMIEFWDELNLKIEENILNPSLFDVIIFAVPHNEFMSIDFSKWNLNSNTLIFNANNVLTSKQTEYIIKNKIQYMSIGRG